MVDLIQQVDSIESNSDFHECLTEFVWWCATLHGRFETVYCKTKINEKRQYQGTQKIRFFVGGAS